jgi:hypothetical protein
MHYSILIGLISIVKGLMISPLVYILVSIVLAGILFLLRTYLRLIYGCFEILIGVGLCFLALSLPGLPLNFAEAVSTALTPVEQTVTVTTYLGAIFVMVRGMDNVKEATARKR